MRADPGCANRVVALCPPLTVLYSSFWPIFTWIGYLAILTAAIATVVSLSGKRLSIYTALTSILIICLIIVGLGRHDFRGAQSFFEVVQLLAFGVIISEFRRI